MEQTEHLILEPLLQEASVKRRQLLPLWIKIFCWFFLFAGTVAPLCVIAGLLFNIEASLALYGMETTNAGSLSGMFIGGLFLLKGIVAYGLWWEKDWAIDLGIGDAIAGITLCTLMMTPIGSLLELAPEGLSLRLEIAVLIPYLIKLQKLKPLWEKGYSTPS